MGTPRILSVVAARTQRVEVLIPGTLERPLQGL